MKVSATAIANDPQVAVPKVQTGFLGGREGSAAMFVANVCGEISDFFLFLQWQTIILYLS